MPSQRSLRLAGQWALIAGVLAIVGLVVLFTFFAVGPPFGLVNDILAIPGILVLLPVGFALYLTGREKSASWSLLALSAFLAGVAGIVALQAVLIAGILSFQEQLPWVLVASASLGLWYALGTHLAGGTLPRGLVRLGVLTGVGAITGAVVFWIGLGLQGGSLGNLADPDAFATLHPLILLGYVLILVVYVLTPAWALWVGRTFLRAAREPPAPES